MTMGDVKSNEKKSELKSLQSISISVISAHITHFRDIEKLPLPEFARRSIEDYWFTDFLYCKDSFSYQKKS